MEKKFENLFLFDCNSDLQAKQNIMITFDEANTFLIEQLKFANWKEVIERNRLEFLKLLVPYYAHNVYFQVNKFFFLPNGDRINDGSLHHFLQNITLSSIPQHARKVPDESDIIAAGLNGIGGNCITQNTFLQLLLHSLGYDSFIVSGTVGDGDLNNHVLCVVRLSPSELYLLDLGVGLPFPEPIPLHNLPYVFPTVGHRIMYRKSLGEFYECVQLDGSLLGVEFVS